MDPQAIETTLYSLSDAPPVPAERREGERHMTLYRVGSLSIGERRELCLIKNISAGGMMVRAYCAIAEDSRLSVELKCGQPISGTVTWTRDVHLGITFDQPIDVIDILSTSAKGPRPRLPRIEVASFVTIREGASTYRMRLCDVSQGGVKVHSESSLAAGSDVIVTLPGMDAQPGVIRWTDGTSMGITFNRMLALVTLVDWLKERRESVRAAD